MDAGSETYSQMLNQVQEALRGPYPPHLKPQFPLKYSVCSFRAKLQELYARQEYYRRAYNEVVGQLTVISHGLPDWVFNYNQTQCVEDQTREDEVTESTDELGPDMLNFMLHTIRHREERDRQKALEEAHSLQLPPLLKSTSQTPDMSLCSAEVQIESYITNYYESISQCREAPLWPVLPLRNVKQ
uniref:PITH domain-containing protein n=1 Tax=Mesocestoides corti TaxID=53468 RepID=A0A5K3EKR3_MESCO